jgi:hypothetical protein
MAPNLLHLADHKDLRSMEVSQNEIERHVKENGVECPIEDNLQDLHVLAHNVLA